MKRWVTYLIETKTPEMFYVGITQDFRQRMREHRGKDPGGAKFTARHGVKRVYILARGIPSIEMARHIERAVAQTMDRTAPSGTVSHGAPFGSPLRLHPAMFGVCTTTMDGKARWETPARRLKTLRRAA